MMKEAAESNAAAVESTQRETLSMILNDPELKKLKLPGKSDNSQNNEDVSVIKGVGTRNQKASVEQLSVFIPSRNRTVRIR
jgi:hypothetical protein